jgi:UDP-N-acetylglucosamine diphosphorylase / glucose-1-phosphate thymidylyltransferase / UDP-N-acetylgalactosamine diphosphorylase / glucosamine-1-phosphate N-acetyltransferase / galactosamine-1-phosphate N-acetyltransferase
MASPLRLADYVATLPASQLAPFAELAPWELTARSREIVARLVAAAGDGYAVADGVAVHGTATVEPGAVLKAPAVIGPGCAVAAGAYVRGGCWLAERCVLGPGAEVKSAFLFAAARLAHFNFVGDSILGADVNLEAGAIVANYRNERADPAVVLRVGGRRIETGVTKFGAVLGDGARVGANAVIAPGAVLPPGAIVPRLGLVDQGGEHG